MIDSLTEIAVVLNPMWGAYDLYLISRDGVRTIARPAQIIFEDTEPGVFHEPYMRLSYEVAQRLIDQLWQAGLRPNNGEGSLANVEALRQHLNDMRAIVASRLEVKL
jgi:hypothetical protein